LENLLDAVLPVVGKRGRPKSRADKLHADKAYNHRRCRPPACAHWQDGFEWLS
jgi:hypothetical protein